MKNISIPEYTLDKIINTGVSTNIYRSITKGNIAVILKVLRDDYPTLEAIARLKHEYSVAKKLEHENIVKALQLENSAEHYAIIFEDFGGISLRQYLESNRPSLETILQVAIAITQALIYIHRKQIVHKDIKPANIIVKNLSENNCVSSIYKPVIKLTDFSIASCLEKEITQQTNCNQLEGTLAYISPEQTGRMNRSLDFRSDFYSLGVTLYEMLTGQLPFISSDPLELIHAHIAEQPTSIHQLNPDINTTVCAIVEKLMAKNVEDRYQSAEGLLADLQQCWKQLQATGSILNFTPGQLEVISQLLIPQKLYGRESQVQLLLNAFERMTKGNSELILVSGYSGIGKTSVINEVNKPIIKAGGYFISGKSDQFKRDIPYASLIQAFSSLCKQLLTESSSQLKRWQNKIQKAVGHNGQVIIDLIPEVELIIGKQVEVPHLEPIEAQNRLNQIFQKFVSLFTKKGHPLVIFLDDLQWVDSASLKLIQLLMTDDNQGYLFLIGAYRDNEVSTAHPLMMILNDVSKSGAVINTITLPALSKNSLNQLVGDTLNCRADIALPFTQLIHQKTKGNPFFSTQFIKALYEEGLIYFDIDAGYWQCDITKVRETALTDDVVEFMALQLQKLPESTQNILKLAACIGNQFDLETLAIVSEQSETQTATYLWTALQEGLILPQSEVYKFYFGEEKQIKGANISQVVNYRFLHDRVQQAAYSLIPEDQKQITHYHIGRLFYETFSETEREERIFDIVNQFNIGIELITEESNRNQLAKLNLLAGRKAKTATAYNAATDYLKLGIDLLPPASWENYYDLTLALYDEAAEAAYLSTNFEEMNQLAEEIHSRAKTLLDRIKVYEVEIQAYMAQNQFIEAIQTGLQVLELLGICFPETPNYSDIQTGMERTFANLGQRNPLELKDISVMCDRTKLAALRILNCVCPCAYQAAPQLLPLLVMEQVNLSMKYGNSAISPTGYAMWALILCGIVEDIDTGYKFGQLALSLLERFDSKEIQAGTIFVVNADVKHYREHIKETLIPLESAYSIGLETGDLKFAALATNIYAYHAYLSGNNLLELRQKIVNYNQFLHNFKQTNTLNLNQGLQQAILNLLIETEDPCQLIGEAYNRQEMLPLHQQANDATAIFYVYFNQMILNYLFANFEQALANAIETEKYLVGVTANFVVPVFYFYDSLVQLAVGTKSIDSNIEIILNRVEANQQKCKNGRIMLR